MPGQQEGMDAFVTAGSRGFLVYAFPDNGGTARVLKQMEAERPTQA